MATWTTIPDSSLEPGKPIRSIDTLALRDNPIAIAEAASGAPAIVLNAIRSALASRVHGEVGSMVIAYNGSATNVDRNGTIAGSSLNCLSTLRAATDTANQFMPMSNNSDTFPVVFAAALTGTWRNMGGYCRGRLAVSGETSTTYYWFPSLWLRIA